MGGMTRNETGGASSLGGVAAAAPPLADVPSCQNLPLGRGSFEPSGEPLLGPDRVLDGRFLIREAIGRSRMATLYRAEDMLHGRRNVVVKMPLRSIEGDPVSFTRFRHEEEIGLGLHHPLLLKFHPITAEKCQPYLVTEYLVGCTLDHVLHASGPLPERDAMTIAGLVCAAVGHMHEQEVIHCDLKPSNIMICRDGTLRVMDFGLSSPPIRKRSVLAKLTPIFGTAEYMAPEQVDNGPIDERTDVYALGAVLYELLTGSVPFKNEDPWQSAFQRTTGDPVAPRVLNPALSLQAEEIVLHALQRKPEDRYSDMAAFLADLSEPERVPVTGYSQRLRPPRWRLSFQATPVLAGILLGLGALLFFALLFLFLFMRFRTAGR